MKSFYPNLHRVLFHVSSVAVMAALVLVSAVRCQAAGPFEPVADYFANWCKRVDQTQAEQPHWMTPLVTVTPRLEEEYRYDQLWHAQPHGAALNNFGANKGLELIPARPIELILSVPGYVSRGGNVQDSNGWADASFLIKYRLLAANEEGGNYIATLFLGISVPTGDDPVSLRHVVYTPTIALGKGWGNFDIQSTVAAALPDGGLKRLGSPIIYNTAFQYYIPELLLWPELETNYSWWPNGEREGKSQLFLTPGVVMGRFHIWRRIRLAVGVGYQIAVTRHPLYNHGVVLSVRMPF
jgi:hypothetical protein